MDATPHSDAPPVPPPAGLPLRDELRGTLLLFLLAVAVTAGCALVANLLVAAVG